MWAQLIKMTIKPESAQDLAGLMEQLQAIEQPDSGLLRTTSMQDQSDPTQVYTLVVFDSEAKARARESDPRRQDGLKALQVTMASMFEGPPEFVDLDVVYDVSRER
jgi:quinol monooxygenase YgiN